MPSGVEAVEQAAALEPVRGEEAENIETDRR